MLQDLYKNTNAVFLAHGYVGKLLGKTINGVIMHSTVFNVVALVDKDNAGIDTSKAIPGVRKKIPVYESFSETIKHQPKVVILMENSINISFNEIKEAIKANMDIINPGFNLLNNNTDLLSLAREYNVKLIDLREPNKIKRNPNGSIRDIKSKVVYIAGTDCGLGKRTATYELLLEAKKREINAAYAATGQTGIMLGCDGGIVIDSISMQFGAGAVEDLIVNIDKKGFDIIFLEGQAAIMHYATSSSVVLLHVGNPHAIVMVHDQKRTMHVEYGDSPIFKMGTLKNEIEIVEKLSLPGGNEFKVVAIATIGDDNIETLEKMRDRNEIPNLPIADARKIGGPEILLDAVLKHLKEKYNWRPGN
ncbi:MAG: DUF1611 domain-containing protein [Cyclobacteriaceae bacterium]|nr:DUF1611 domain-containing protein [Cyclobacteriaceae bacterium]